MIIKIGLVASPDLVLSSDEQTEAVDIFNDFCTELCQVRPEYTKRGAEEIRYEAVPALSAANLADDAWFKLFGECFGFIYLLDATRTSSLPFIQHVLASSLANSRSHSKPCVLLALGVGKPGSMSVEQITSGLPKEDSLCLVCLNTIGAENTAAQQGFQWLLDFILSHFDALKLKVALETESDMVPVRIGLLGAPNVQIDRHQEAVLLDSVEEFCAVHTQGGQHYGELGGDKVRFDAVSALVNADYTAFPDSTHWANFLSSSFAFMFVVQGSNKLSLWSARSMLRTFLAHPWCRNKPCAIFVERSSPTEALDLADVEKVLGISGTDLPCKLFVVENSLNDAAQGLAWVLAMVRINYDQLKRQVLADDERRRVPVHIGLAGSLPAEVEARLIKLFDQYGGALSRDRSDQLIFGSRRAVFTASSALSTHSLDDIRSAPARKFLQQCCGFAYLVDAADDAHVRALSAFLQELVSHPEHSGKPVAVLAYNFDAPGACALARIESLLEGQLDELETNPWTCAGYGGRDVDNNQPVLQSGFEWLVDSIRSDSTIVARQIAAEAGYVRVRIGLVGTPNLAVDPESEVVALEVFEQYCKTLISQRPEYTSIGDQRIRYVGVSALAAHVANHTAIDAFLTRCYGFIYILDATDKSSAAFVASTLHGASADERCRGKPCLILCVQGGAPGALTEAEISSTLTAKLQPLASSWRVAVCDRPAIASVAVSDGLSWLLDSIRQRFNALHSQITALEGASGKRIVRIGLAGASNVDNSPDYEPRVMDLFEQFCLKFLEHHPEYKTLGGEAVRYAAVSALASAPLRKDSPGASNQKQFLKQCFAYVYLVNAGSVDQLQGASLGDLLDQVVAEPATVGKPVLLIALDATPATEAAITTSLSALNKRSPWRVAAGPKDLSDVQFLQTGFSWLMGQLKDNYVSIAIQSAASNSRPSSSTGVPASRPECTNLRLRIGLASAPSLVLNDQAEACALDLFEQFCVDLLRERPEYGRYDGQVIDYLAVSALAARKANPANLDKDLLASFCTQCHGFMFLVDAVDRNGLDSLAQLLASLRPSVSLATKPVVFVVLLSGDPTGVVLDRAALEKHMASLAKVSGFSSHHVVLGGTLDTLSAELKSGFRWLVDSTRNESLKTNGLVQATQPAFPTPPGATTATQPAPIPAPLQAKRPEPVQVNNNAAHAETKAAKAPAAQVAPKQADAPKTRTLSSDSVMVHIGMAANPGMALTSLEESMALDSFEKLCLSVLHDHPQYQKLGRQTANFVCVSHMSSSTASVDPAARDQYLDKCQGFLYVFDATKAQGLPDVKHTLRILTNDPRAKTKPVILLAANADDAAAIPVASISNFLALDGRDTLVRIVQCRRAPLEEHPDLREAFIWMVEAIRRQWDAKSSEVSHGSGSGSGSKVGFQLPQSPKASLPLDVPPATNVMFNLAEQPARLPYTSRNTPYVKISVGLAGFPHLNAGPEQEKSVLEFFEQFTAKILSENPEFQKFGDEVPGFVAVSSLSSSDSNKDPLAWHRFLTQCYAFIYMVDSCDPRSASAARDIIKAASADPRCCDKPFLILAIDADLATAAPLSHLLAAIPCDALGNGFAPCKLVAVGSDVARSRGANEGFVWLISNIQRRFQSLRAIVTAQCSVPEVVLKIGLAASPNLGVTDVEESQALDLFHQFSAALLRDRPDRYAKIGGDAVAWAGVSALATVNQQPASPDVWAQFLHECFGFIFVADAAQPSSLPAVRRVLEGCFADPRTASKPVAILLVNGDVQGALSNSQVQVLLGLDDFALHAPYKMFSTGLALNDCLGVREAFIYVVETVRTNYEALKVKILGNFLERSSTLSVKLGLTASPTMMLNANDERQAVDIVQQLHKLILQDHPEHGVLGGDRLVYTMMPALTAHPPDPLHLTAAIPETPTQTWSEFLHQCSAFIYIIDSTRQSDLLVVQKLLLLAYSDPAIKPKPCAILAVNHGQPSALSDDSLHSLLQLDKLGAAVPPKIVPCSSIFDKPEQALPGLEWLLKMTALNWVAIETSFRARKTSSPTARVCISVGIAAAPSIPFSPTDEADALSLFEHLCKRVVDEKVPSLSGPNVEYKAVSALSLHSGVAVPSPQVSNVQLVDWSRFLSNCFGSIYVIDSTNVAALPAARRGVHWALSEATSGPKPCLIIAMNQDEPAALPLPAMSGFLGLNTIGPEKNVHLVGLGRIAGQPDSLRQGLVWLLDTIRARYAELKPTVAELTHDPLLIRIALAPGPHLSLDPDAEKATLSLCEKLCQSILDERPQYGETGGDRVAYVVLSALSSQSPDLATPEDSRSLRLAEASLYSRIMTDCYGFMYLLDAADVDGIAGSCRVLRRLLRQPSSFSKPWIILVLNQDQENAVALEHINRFIDGEKSTPYMLVGCAGPLIQSYAMRQAMLWIMDTIRHNYRRLQSCIVNLAAKPVDAVQDTCIELVQDMRELEAVFAQLSFQSRMKQHQLRLIQAAGPSSGTSKPANDLAAAPATAEKATADTDADSQDVREKLQAALDQLAEVKGVYSDTVYAMEKLRLNGESMVDAYEAQCADLKAKVASYADQLQQLRDAQDDASYAAQKLHKNATAITGMYEQQIADLKAQVSNPDGKSREELDDLRGAYEKALAVAELLQTNGEKMAVMYEEQVRELKRKVAAMTVSSGTDAASELIRLRQEHLELRSAYDDAARLMGGLQQKGERMVGTYEAEIRSLKAALHEFVQATSSLASSAAADTSPLKSIPASTHADNRVPQNLQSLHEQFLQLQQAYEGATRTVTMLHNAGQLMSETYDRELQAMKLKINEQAAELQDVREGYEQAQHTVEMLHSAGKRAVEAYDMEVCMLKTKLDSKERDLQELRHSYDVAVFTIDRLNQATATLTKSHSDDVDSMRNTVVTKSRQLDEAYAMLERANKECAQLRAALGKLPTPEEYQQKQLETQSKIDGANQELQEVRQAYDTLLSSAETLRVGGERMIEQYDSEVGGLRAQLLEVQNHVRTLEEEKVWLSIEGPQRMRNNAVHLLNLLIPDPERMINAGEDFLGSLGNLPGTAADPLEMLRKTGEEWQRTTDQMRSVTVPLRAWLAKYSSSPPDALLEENVAQLLPQLTSCQRLQEHKVAVTAVLHLVGLELNKKERVQATLKYREEQAQKELDESRLRADTEAQLRSQLNVKERTLQRLEKDLIDKDSMISALRSSVQSLEEESARAARGSHQMPRGPQPASIQGTMADVGHLQAAMQNMDGALQRKDAQVNELMSKLNAREDALNAANAALHDREQQLAAKDQALVKLRSLIASLLEDASQLQQPQQADRQQQVKLLQRMDAVRQEYDSLVRQGSHDSQDNRVKAKPTKDSAVDNMSLSALADQRQQSRSRPQQQGDPAQPTRPSAGTTQEPPQGAPPAAAGGQGAAYNWYAQSNGVPAPNGAAAGASIPTAALSPSTQHPNPSPARTRPTQDALPERTITPPKKLKKVKAPVSGAARPVPTYDTLYDHGSMPYRHASVGRTQERPDPSQYSYGTAPGRRSVSPMAHAYTPSYYHPMYAAGGVQLPMGMPMSMSPFSQSAVALPTMAMLGSPYLAQSLPLMAASYSTSALPTADDLASTDPLAARAGVSLPPVKQPRDFLTSDGPAAVDARAAVKSKAAQQRAHQGYATGQVPAILAGGVPATYASGPYEDIIPGAVGTRTHPRPVYR